MKYRLQKCQAKIHRDQASSPGELSPPPAGHEREKQYIARSSATSPLNILSPISVNSLIVPATPL